MRLPPLLQWFRGGRPDTLRRSLLEARKMVKFYDVFIFFNELELLDIRLRVLDPVVDYFVIVEATETFTGRKKPLHFRDNRARFAAFHQKIIHYVVDDMPRDRDDLCRRLQDPQLTSLDRQIINDCLTSDNIPPDQAHWLREFYQKESMKKPLLNLQDNDVCFISDIDEIWNPLSPFDFRTDDVYKMRQQMYAYFVNNRSSEPWAGTFATKYKNIRSHSINHLDTPSKTKYRMVNNGGWHFTNLGGADRIRQKLESYGHQEYNTEDIKTQIEQRIEQNKDFIGRKFRFSIDERGLPDYLLGRRRDYPQLFK